jgi:hypothetical protein
MSSALRWTTVRQAKLLKCGRSEKEVTTPFATHPKNHNLGKSLTTPAIVLEKKILHE